MVSCGSAFRLVVYVFVLAAMGMQLFGILRTKAEVNLDDGYCLLGGQWKKEANGNRPEPGSKSLCEFVIFSAVAQIIACILLGVLTVIRCVTHRDKEHSAFTFLEVIMVVPLVLVACAAALGITIGLYVFCSRLVAGTHWEENAPYSDVDKPGSCKDSFVLYDNNTHNKYYFFYNFNIGQVGAWAGVVLWLAHSIISIISFRGYRRERRLGTAHADLASAEGTSVGKYANMKNAAAL